MLAGYFIYNLSMETLLIIDGSNLLFQMFYGIPKKIYNSRGETIHATIGFSGALFRMVRLVNPRYICVIFDTETPSERVLWDENYKANRIKDWDSLPQDEVPFYEIAKIKKVLSHLHIHYQEAVAREADDLISSLVRQFQKDYAIVISSYDSDFFQLLNDHVRILRYRGEKTVIFDQDLFFEKYGFQPDKYVFYKALTGDTADNIPGLAKIGPKRAASLVNRYRDYEEILEDLVNVNPKCIRDSLCSGQDRFRLNRQLIDLHKEQEAEFTLADLAFDAAPFQETSNAVLSRLRIY